MITLLVVAALAEEDPGALSDEAYRFCHEAGFDAEAAKEWCALLEHVPPERCPGLRATCEGAADPGRGCEAFDPGRGPADGLAGGAEPPPRAPQGCEPLDPTSLEGLQAVLRWTLAMGVAVVVLLLARLLFRSFGGGARSPTVTAPIPEVAVEEAALDVPEAPSTDQLSAARAALEAGRYGDAVVLARGAALRALGERGRLKLHRSRTDREYARSVRSDPEVGADLAEVVGAHERHRFGGAGADRALAERALAAAARLLGLALVALLLPRLASAETRYDTNGDAALLEVLDARGYDVGYRLRSLTELDEDTDVLVLDLAAVIPDAEQWAAVRAWVEAGGVLVVGGDASEGFPELGERGWVDDQSLTAELTSPAFAGALPTPVWAGGPFAWWDGGTGRTLVEAPGAGPVVQLLDLGPGVVVAIADPRLLWNAAFVSPANEAFVGDLVYVGQQLEGWPVPTPARVQLATAAAAASEGGSPDPLRSMARARLLPFVLQLVLAWIVLALWRGRAFAPLRDPPEERGERFVEHVEALGSHWARSRSSGWAARAWAGLWLSRLGPAGLESAAVRAGRTREEAAAFAAEVERRAAGDGAGRDPADHAWMEELWRVTRSGRS